MTDPGSGWSNPIWYRDYRIYLNPDAPGSFAQYCYEHDDYDGAPDSHDHRYGHCESVSECRNEIDELEDGL